MPVPRPIRAAAFGLLALVALPAAAEPASFDFTIAGFKVGQVVMEEQALRGRCHCHDGTLRRAAVVALEVHASHLSARFA